MTWSAVLYVNGELQHVFIIKHQSNLSFPTLVKDQSIPILHQMQQRSSNVKRELRDFNNADFNKTVVRGIEPGSGQTKYYEIGICCFSTKHATLRSKEWLARDDMSIS
jgi:hypothetical protein